MIKVVDYGLGNVRAIKSAYARLGIETESATNTDELKDATHMVIPGVGSFDDAMKRLEGSGMIGMIRNKVEEEMVPVLGICVGMQVMLNGSDEGRRKGIGWFDGYARRLDSREDSANLRCPHVGWNHVEFTKDLEVLNESTDGHFFFLHSYYAELRRMYDSYSLGLTVYENKFISAIKRENVFGVQFHPEKSHGAGLALLKVFAES